MRKRRRDNRAWQKLRPREGPRTSWRMRLGRHDQDDDIIISAAQDASLDELYAVVEQAHRVRQQIVRNIGLPMIEPGTVSGLIIHLKASGWSWKQITDLMARVLDQPGLTERQVLRWANAAGWTKETAWRYATDAEQGVDDLDAALADSQAAAELHKPGFTEALIH